MNMTIPGRDGVEPIAQAPAERKIPASALQQLLPGAAENVA
jgi:hypothetical protein